MGYRRLTLRKSLKLSVNKLYRYPVWIAFGISVSLLLGCALVIAIKENIGFFEALLRVLPLIFGELGDIEWKNPLAKFAAAIALIAGVVFIAIIGAKIVTWFVNLSLKGGRIMKRVNYKDHIIICGWNIQGKNIIKQLLSATITQTRPIVILANLEKKPIDEDRVDFISGDPTKREDLERAGIKTANTAIILTGMDSGSQGDINPDAQAVLMTLAVETARREVYTCVQLLNSAYREHLEHVHVDEYICLDHLGGSLMVASALNHGLSWILNELLTFNVGSEFYKVDVPREFVGRGFREVAKILHDEEMILIAVETETEVPRRDEEGKVIIGENGNLEMRREKKRIVNPLKGIDYPAEEKDYILKRGDSLYVIAAEEPTKEEMKKIAEKSISVE